MKISKKRRLVALAVAIPECTVGLLPGRRLIALMDGRDRKCTGPGFVNRGS
jgi:hypothetical protein